MQENKWKMDTKTAQSPRSSFSRAGFERESDTKNTNREHLLSLTSISLKLINDTIINDSSRILKALPRRVGAR